MERYRHWIALKRAPGVGNVLYKRLIERFKAPEKVFAADETALLSVEGICKEVAQGIRAFSAFDEIDQEFEKIEKAGASLLCFNDADYPPLLAAIYDPPPLLYWKGGRGEADPYPLAVVGARKTTAYGRAVTERICRDLVQQGVTVVSGFARGVDGYAHRAALAAEGRTVAVLGSGIDVVYPREHRQLFDQIIAQGAIFTEFEMGASPEAHHFPQRNRVISGLSLGCVVMEAAFKSGSLITARMALDQGREVFAVPGSIFSGQSAGCHQLIQSGAKLVAGAADILEELLPQFTSTSAFRGERPLPLGAPEEIPGLDEDEKKMYGLLSLEPKHIDQVIHEGAFGLSQVSHLLLALELKGRARQLGGQFYVRV